MNEIVMIPVGPIAKSPAQMRTTYDLQKLAELTLLILTRGFEGDRPLLVRQTNGSGYENIRGHRRRMATLMSRHLLAQKENWEIESIRKEWAYLVDGHRGDVERAAESLVAEHGAFEVPALIFQGDSKQATLALWSDNFGDEDPDMLGVARSLLVGVSQGIDPVEAAAHMGQSPHYVHNHLALAQLEEEFPVIVERIINGNLGMSVATVLLDLSPDRRAALGRFIQMTPASSVTTGGVKGTARLLKAFAFEMPLSFANSTRRNLARAFINLWHRRYGEDPVRAYLAACVVLSSRSQYVPPWEDPVVAQEWLRALGEPVEGHWMRAIEPYLHEVSCETCPIMQLPDQVLKVDLVSPSLPCRTGWKGQVGKCMHGLHPDDPFHMRVPMSWAEHPGVQRDASGYFCATFADLRKAWQAQQEAEEAEAKKEQRAAARVEAQKKQTAGGSPRSSAPAATPTPSPSPSPIEQMRDKVRGFMANYDQYNAGHFLAMTCDGCQHKLAESPTSDPDVPHCAWATHNRIVRFEQLVPAGGKLQPIPVCRQYAPERPWRELIPEYAAPSEMSREWLLAQIRLLADDRRGSETYKRFQWLTGRPLSSSERYEDWFTEQLAANQGELSNGQVYALFVLAHVEWSRCRGTQEFLLPVDKRLMQMEPAKVSIWQVEVKS